MTDAVPGSKNPLSLSLDRIWIYGACCAITTSLPFIILPWFHDVIYRGDFGYFWSAGSNVGTTTLTNPERLYAWQRLHHLSTQPFFYPPGFAWIYAPLSHLPPVAGLVTEELVMTAVFLASALIAARAYGFGPWFSIAAVFAWGPTMNAIEVGQNTGLTLLLLFWTCWALLNQRSSTAGLAVGLMLYKPTVAIPLILLLIVRRQWHALAAVTVCAFGWYLLSVAASHGDWLWPVTYLRTVASWLPVDFRGSAFKAFTVPTLLMGLGVNLRVASFIGVAILALALPLAARVPILQAASMMPLVGLAASPHAWPYEGALALPSVFYAMTRFREPWRTRIIAATYIALAVGLVTHYGAWVLAIVCIGGSGLWMWSGYRGIVSRLANVA